MNYYNNNKQALSDLISDLENDNGVLLIAKEDVESELEYAEKCHSLEEELGCPLDVLFKAFKNGIWSKEHLEYPNEYCRQRFPFRDVMPQTKDNEWYLYFKPKAYGNTGLETANIFWDRVKISDYKKTWWLKENREE